MLLVHRTTYSRNSTRGTLPDRTAKSITFLKAAVPSAQLVGSSVRLADLVSFADSICRNTLKKSTVRLEPNFAEGGTINEGPVNSAFCAKTVHHYIEPFLG